MMQRMLQKLLQQQLRHHSSTTMHGTVDRCTTKLLSFSRSCKRFTISTKYSYMMLHPASTSPGVIGFNTDKVPHLVQAITLKDVPRLAKDQARMHTWEHAAIGQPPALTCTAPKSHPDMTAHHTPHRNAPTGNATMASSLERQYPSNSPSRAAVGSIAAQPAQAQFSRLSSSTA